jgi:hypothetical protein
LDRSLLLCERLEGRERSDNPRTVHGSSGVPSVLSRRTVFDKLRRPWATRELIPLNPQGREAIDALRDAYLAGQRQVVAFLNARYPSLPWVLDAVGSLTSARRRGASAQRLRARNPR